MDKKAFFDQLAGITEARFREAPRRCSAGQLYEALLELTQAQSLSRRAPDTGRKLYYFSAEFLMGRLLQNNLLSLGLYDVADEVLQDCGYTLSSLEELEPEPSLGNGGLGRLAACFLDSIAALGLPGDGVGLNYHYGLFRQQFEDYKQQEQPNPWMEEPSWLMDTGLRFTVPFGFGELQAKLYDILIPGADGKTVNRLHLFDVEQPSPAPQKGISFDKGDIAHCLTSFLYPDDSDEAGRILRVYQQYFMVSAGAQLILKELDDRELPVSRISDYVAIQINDTHPSMVIPELIRLLTVRGMKLEEAVRQVENTCAYTNHTILAEALEKWPLSYLEQVAPQLVPILKALDEKAKTRTQDPRIAILDGENRVHMAHMDIHFSHSVNGVAVLHTEILKNQELKPFYGLYPEKFNNKTNGITFRRWLQVCNPRLSKLIDDCIGTSWRQDPEELQKLMKYASNDVLLVHLLEMKKQCKQDLAEKLLREQKLQVDPESIFDIQIKRLHEYKRQQMNALYVIWQYLQIKAGNYPEHPITVIFGGKAAPAYVMAKNIIHLILCLQQLTESDPQVSPWLRVVMVENYNVSWAESLIPACDLSEQISLASKEASGTGNMKFMANGAVTLGTMDGANVEIAQLVGKDQIYTFGCSSERVISLYETGGYRAEDYYGRETIRPLVDFLLSPELLAIGDEACLRALWQDLRGKDWFMALLDVEDYIKTKCRAIHDYGNPQVWAGKMLKNIAMSGYFSSDRTIRQYNEEIWHLK